MPTISPNLDHHKAVAIAEVTTQTGKLRLEYATDGPFQSIAYQLKRDEAAAYLALDPLPADLTGFPLLAGITVLRGMTAAGLATLWINTNDERTPVLKQTEIVRDGAVFAIKSATTRSEIDAVMADFESALSNLKQALAGG